MTAPQRHWPSELAAVAAAALLLAPLTLYMPPLTDELTYLSHGLRQLQGAVIYRDFFEFATPVSSWLAAAVFAVTGPDLLAARIVQAALIVFTSWLLYQLARRLGVGPWGSALPGLALVVAMFRAFPVYSHHWVVMPFLFGALLSAVRGLEDGRRRWWLLAGAGAGLGTLTMQSDGAAILGTIAGGTAIATVLAGEPWRTGLRRLTLLALGVAAPAGLAAAYLLFHGALGAAYEQVWLWPLTHYKPAGGINDVKYLMDFARHNMTNEAGWVNMPFWYGRFYHVLYLYMMPPVAALGALAWGLGLVWRCLATGQRLSSQEGALGLVGLAAVAFMAVLLHGRADFTHAAFYAVPATLLACAAAVGWRRALQRPEWVLVRWLPSLSLVLLVATGGMLAADSLRRQPSGQLASERIVAEDQALAYLRAHAAPGDRIISLPAGGAHYFYGLPPASRFTMLFPPMMGYNSPDELGELVREVKTRRPAYILLADRFITVSGHSTIAEALRGYERVEGEFANPLHGPTRIYKRRK